MRTTGLRTRELYWTEHQPKECPVRAIPLLACLLLAQSAGMPAPAAFDRYFTDDTMRVDYFHTGGPKSGETLALDRVVNDGAWAGSRTQLVDSTNLGTY